MPVFRVEKTKNYTVMSNYHLRDRNISLKAKGLLSQMLSLPENWDFTLDGLAYINSEGKDAIRTAIRELEQAGYICRSRVRDEKGCLRGAEYVIYEQPQNCPNGSDPRKGDKANPDGHDESCPATHADETAPIPASVIPMQEKPASENPTLGETTQLNKDIRSKDKQNTDPLKSLPFFSLRGRLVDRAVRMSGAKRNELGAEGRAAINIQTINTWQEQIKKNIDYDVLVQESPYDKGQLDEMVSLMTETICSTRDTLRICGENLPKAVVKARLLKLNGDHIRFVFECLRENTTKVRNIKQYLLAVLYNAPVTIENSYAAQVGHDFAA